jgi:O-antigen/teichoic acid export membrane protein
VIDPVKAPPGSTPSEEDGADAAPITRGHAFRDILIQVVGRSGNLILGVLVVVVMTRALGVDGTGEWSTLIAISTITGYLIDPGLQTTAIRMASANPHEEAGWLGALASLRLFTGLIAAFVCFAVSATVATSGAMVIAAALISATALTSFAQSFAVIFQLRVRNDRAIAFMTLNSLLWTAGVVVVAVLGGGLVAFATAFLFTSTFTVAAQAVYVWRHNSLALTGLRRHGRDLLRVGLPLGIALALTIAYGKIDQVLVLHYQGTHGAGLYGAAYSLLDRVQFLPAVLMTTVFPIISAAWPADMERARRAVQRVLGLMAMVSFPALAFTIGAARPLLVLLFGEQFAPAAGALRVLMLAFIPGCFGYVAGSLAVVVGRQRPLALVALVGLVFNVVGNLLLLPHHGYIAAAWMTAATEFVVIWPAMIMILRAMHVAPDLGKFPRVAASASIMGVAVWVAHLAGVGIVILGLTGVIVYPVALIATGALRPDDRAELFLWLRRRSGREGAPREAAVPPPPDTPEAPPPALRTGRARVPRRKQLELSGRRARRHTDLGFTAGPPRSGQFRRHRRGPRPRHDVVPMVLFALQPLFRYSLKHDAWILRAIGDKHGPVLRARPKAEPAPSGPRPRDDATSREIYLRRRFVVLALVSAVIAAVLGFLIAQDIGSHPSSIALKGHAKAGPIEVSFPSGWQRQPAPAMPRLRLTDELALAPVQASGEMLVIGRTAAADPQLVPQRLLADPAGAPMLQIVMLRKVSFYRYLNLPLPGAHSSESVYAVPTTVGTIVGICLARKALPGFAIGCERTLGSLRLDSGTFLPLGPSPAYASALDSVISRLNVVRAGAGSQLQSARDAGEQAKAADELAAAHAAAASELMSLSPGPAAVANSAVASALKLAAGAYRALARAAATDNARGYDTASTSLTRATGALDSALGQLSTLRYRVG